MRELHVEPGDEVRVRAARGELVVAAAGDAGVPCGVALLQFNSAPAGEMSASALLDSSVPAVEVGLEKVT
jgi:formylmethanofuran dehydrogenase subunit D